MPPADVLPVPDDDSADGSAARSSAAPDSMEAIGHQLERLERRLDQRLAELRVRQEEEIMLLKALSCQLRSRVERVERRTARSGA